MQEKDNWDVDKTNQVQLTVEYTRGEVKPKFTFAVVARTVVLGAALMAILSLSGFGPVNVYADSESYNAYSTTYVNNVTGLEDPIRFAGLTRYDTAAEIAIQGWGTANTVILAYGENYPDALASVPLAKKLNAPILLTDNKSLTPKTKQTLQSLKTKSVVIVGGTAVVSQDVEREISNMGVSTSRLAGYDRYDTAVEIAKQFSSVDTVFFATGEDYADALSVGSIASIKKAPVLLLPQDGTIPASVQSYLSSHNIKTSYVALCVRLVVV